MRGVVRYIAIVVLMLVVGNEASAQWMKERGWVRKGNRQYEKSNFEQSVESYEKALQYDPTSFEAKYDLASALYKSGRYDKAEGTLKSLLSDSTRTELERGELAYNLGNTQFAQKKYKEALSSYRYAMRCNPNDEDAKYNYAFTKRMMQQQEQQQNQENKDNQNQDQKGENQEGQGDGKGQQDKQDNKDKQENKDGSQKPENQQNGNDKQEGGQPSESDMNKAQQEAILQAIQAQEDKTQDKLKEKAVGVIKGGRNW